MVNCRICDTKAGLFGTYLRSALEVSRLYEKPVTSNGVEIKLYGCPVCGHYQIPYVNTEDYYDDYVMTASHSPKMQRLQGEQAKRLFSFARNKDSFIEIGCGDGSFLSHAQQLFRKVLGVEPSRPFYDLCKRRGLDVINDYLTEKLAYDHSFDAFASRQVFEHVPDPLQILSIIHSIVDKGAAGLIEVPNAQKMLDENRYFDLFSDHINYFTPLSLCYLAKKAGFGVISVQESFNGDYLELYVRKKHMALSLEEKREADFTFIKNTATRYKHVSAWGAGAKAQAIMTAMSDGLDLNYLFDTDPHKQGRYIVNCKTAITAPETVNINKNDLIIIFAVSYQDEIMESLQKDHNYAGDILCLEGENPCIVRI